MRKPKKVLFAVPAVSPWLNAVVKLRFCRQRDYTPRIDPHLPSTYDYRR